MKLGTSLLTSQPWILRTFTDPMGETNLTRHTRVCKERKNDDLLVHRPLQTRKKEATSKPQIKITLITTLVILRGFVFNSKQ